MSYFSLNATARAGSVKAEGLEVRSLAEGLPEINSRFVVVVGGRGTCREVARWLHV
ncbi:MAG: hypothetical protein ACO2PM_07970 [Pyrobaculum sp.]